MNITPKSVSLERLLTGLDTSFTVPKYQRRYAWTKNELEELWEDILNASRRDEQYFMGTLVLNKEDHEQDQFDVIDGQQRLATFTILFAVVRNLGHAFRSEDTPIFREVERNEDSIARANKMALLAERRIFEQSEPDHYYLTLGKKDNSTFREVIQNTEPLISDSELKEVRTESRIKKAQKYFYRQISKHFYSTPDGLDQLYEFTVYIIKKLVFITIEVETDYDAYLLFESLNARGLNLSTADLLKNKLLMKCKDNADHQQRVLAGWGEMEDSIKESRYGAVEYIRFYWAAYRDTVTKKELYRELRRSLDSTDPQIRLKAVQLAEDLALYSGDFRLLTLRENTWPPVRHQEESEERYLGEINTLSYSICIPALLYATNERRSDLKHLAKITVSYLFRYITVSDGAVGVAGQAFNEVLANLKRGLEMSEIVARLKDSSGYVSDDSFKEAFRTFQVERNELAKYVLSRLHCHFHGFELLPNHRRLWLEHVLPQSPEKWLSPTAGSFDAGDRRIEDWIYHIGNMTLIDQQLNRRAQNAVFPEKVVHYRKRIDGNGGTVVPMTYEIHEQYESNGRLWSREWIQERADAWADAAPDVWPL